MDTPFTQKPSKKQLSLNFSKNGNNAQSTKKKFTLQKKIEPLEVLIVGQKLKKNIFSK